MMRKVAVVFIIIVSLFFIFHRIGVQEKTIPFQSAPQHVGERVWVRGEVDHVFVSGNNHYFLNFCPDFLDCPFYAVVFSENVHLFEELEELRKVKIYGKISLYQGRPQIVIEDPSQLKSY